jgi:aryl carrier-like protein
MEREHGKKVGIDMTIIYQASTLKQWADTILTHKNYITETKGETKNG